MKNLSAWSLALILSVPVPCYSQKINRKSGERFFQFSIAPGLIFLVLLFSCAHRLQTSQPYACGPVLNQEGITKTFPTIIDFIGIKPGEAFAEVGASGGYYTVMMSTLLNDVDIYIQDIDTTCLNQREFDKVINYYSNQSHLKLREQNTFHLTIGSFDQTNLSNGTFDHIYTNATIHVFRDPNKMIGDMRSKLKDGGTLVIRDSFSDKDKKEYCSDKSCGMPLMKADSLIGLMTRHGFALARSSSDLRGYPAYKFVKLTIKY